MADQMYVDWDGLQYYHGKITQYISTVSEGFFKAGGDIPSFEGIRPCYDNLNYVYKLTNSFSSDHDFVTPGYNYAEGTLVYVREINGAYKFDILVDAVKRDEDFTHDLINIRVTVQDILNTLAELPTKNYVAQAVADLGDYVDDNYATLDELKDACDDVRDEIPSLDGYATEGFVALSIGDALTPYASKDYVDGCITTLNVPRNTSDLVNDAKFVNISELTAVADTKSSIGHKHNLSDIEDYVAPDLSSYAKINQLPKKTSELINDSGYLTKHQDLSAYAKTSDVNAAVSQVSARVDLNTTNVSSLSQRMQRAEDSIISDAKKIDEADRRIDTLEVNVALKANKTDVPTRISDLHDDIGLVGHQDIVGKADVKHIHSIADIPDYVAPKVPVNVSDLANDKKYQTEDDLKAALNKIPTPDLTPYATTAWVNSQKFLTKVPDSYVTEVELNNKGYLQSIPSEYITESELANKGYLTALDLNTYAKKSEIPSVVADLTDSNDYAKKTYVQNEIKEAVDSIVIPEVDLKNYATKDYVASEISAAVFGGNEVVEEALKDLTKFHYTKEETYSKDEVYNKQESYSKAEVNTKLSGYAKTEDLDPYAKSADLKNYASKDYVAAEIVKIPPTDLSNYYKKSEVDSMIPSLTGYATETFVKTQLSELNIPVALKDLTADANHRVVTDAEKAVWNAKSDFSGSYHDLADKPELNFIPAAKESTFATKVDVQGKADAAHVHSYHELNDKPDLSVYALNTYVDNKLGSYVTANDYAADKATFLTTSDGYATQTWVENKNYLIEDDIANKAEKSEIIKKTSELTNDAKFTTLEEVANVGYILNVDDKLDVSTYNNDKETFALKANIPDVSKFITAEDVPSYIPEEYVTNDEITNLVTKEELEAVQNVAGQNSVKLFQLDSDLVDINAKLETIPTKVSELENDARYSTTDYVDDKVKVVSAHISATRTDTGVVIHYSDIDGSGDTYLNDGIDGKDGTTIHYSITDTSDDEFSDEPRIFTISDFTDTITYDLPELGDLIITRNSDYWKVTAKGSGNSHVGAVMVARGKGEKGDTADLSNYYNKTEVDGLIEGIEIPTVPTNVSAFTNDAGYLTEHQSLDGYAKTSDIPDVSNFITMSDVEAKKYLVASDIAGKLDTQTYNADKATFANKDDIQTALSTVPDIVLFNENYLVNNPVGGFANGESVMGMTLRNMFIKLLGLEIYVPIELPEGTPEEVVPIVNDKKPAYVLGESGELVEATDSKNFYKELTESDAKKDNQEESFFYQILNDSGEVVESGYHVSTVYQENDFLTILIPNSITNFHPEVYDAGAGDWATPTWNLVPTESYAVDGYTAYTVPAEFEILSGIAVRIVIDE